MGDRGGVELEIRQISEIEPTELADQMRGYGSRLGQTNIKVTLRTQEATFSN